MTANEHLLFVYGTLRKGLSNHHLLRGARFLGAGRTCRLYSLFMGDYPYAAKQPAVCHIHGEVYCLDDASLARVDELERHPEWYCREEVDVLHDDGRTLCAWLYFHPCPNGRLIKDGDILQILKR